MSVIFCTKQNSKNAACGNKSSTNKSGHPIENSKLTKPFGVISNKGSEIYKKYEKPFRIDNSCTILAYSKIGNEKSNTISATFIKKPNNYSVKLNSKYNPQYHAGGDEGLIDGIFGSQNWRKGDWQGYQGQDFEAVIDLNETKKVKSIAARFLQDSRAWILMPTKADYYVSEDNVNFKFFGSVANTIAPKAEEKAISDFIRADKEKRKQKEERKTRIIKQKS